MDSKEIPIYREWQLPRAATFIPHLMVFPSFWLILAPINNDFGLVLGVTATVFSIWFRFALSKRITVTSNALRVGKASIPRSAIGVAESIAKSEQFGERGPKLDARAFVALQALDGLVKVELVDPNDPTPYLLISTRRPEQLARVLNNLSND